MTTIKLPNAPTKIYGEAETRLSAMHHMAPLLDLPESIYTHRRFAYVDRDVKSTVLEMLRSTGVIPPSPVPKVVEKAPAVKPQKVKSRGKQRDGNSRVWGEVGGMNLMQLNFSNLDADVLDPLEH